MFLANITSTYAAGTEVVQVKISDNSSDIEKVSLVLQKLLFALP